MSDDLQILLVVLLSLAVGAAALIYYLRTRRRSSHAEPAPSAPGATTTRNSGATLLDDEHVEPSLPESGSGDDVPGTLPVSGDEAGRSDPAAGHHEDIFVASEPAEKLESIGRPDEGAVRGAGSPSVERGDGDLPTAAISSDAADQEELASAGGRDSDSTFSQAESERTCTGEVAKATKDAAADAERDTAPSSAPEIQAFHSGAKPEAALGGAETDAGSEAALSAGTAEQIGASHDQVPAGPSDGQEHAPVEPTPPTGIGETAIPSDVAAGSPDDTVRMEEPGKEQDPREEEKQPPKSADEVEAPGAAEREDSGLQPDLQVPAGPAAKEASFAVRGGREAEDPGASVEPGEVVETLDASRDDGEEGEAQVAGVSEDASGTNADHSSQSTEMAATAAAEDNTDRPSEEQSPAEAPAPDQSEGAGGVVAEAEVTSALDEERPPGPTGDDESAEPDSDLATITQAPRKKRTSKKKPRKYKGLARAAPQPRDAAPQPGHPQGQEPAQRERSLPIEVRLRFDRGGFCSVALIAKRSAGLPEDLTAIAGAGEVNLRAMQDEWYQDVVPDDFSSVLRNGTVWTEEGANGRYTWSLSGRALYVLADRSDISGYVSQPCLDLGRDHVVLCTDPLRSRVEEAIRKTGAQPSTVLDDSFGAPAGWVVFRSVVPTAPVSAAEDADVLNALRPLPRIEISLERGIRLGYANYLSGHPPAIRVYGDPEHASAVRIDGQVAVRDEDSAYRAPGWDSVGAHSVWCAGTSRSYSIVPFEASWELWDAYAFPVAAGGTRRLAVCGPIVRAAATEPWGSESISVPETNPILLGPEPGQIVMAVKASPLRGAPRIASPSFRPIWALPRDPLHCDKRTTRILFVAGSEVPEPGTQRASGPRSGTDADITRWSQLILNANRKGMTTDPETESVRALWLSYKRIARRIWRSRR